MNTDARFEQIGDNPPPFWKQFGFFFAYLKQEKLYYQITLLAFANILLLIPSIIIVIFVGAMLFLASYKLAFEVLHTVSSGQFTYADGRSYEIDDKIGFKAIAMAILQLLIFLFIYRNDPPVGLALLILKCFIKSLLYILGLIAKHFLSNIQVNIHSYTFNKQFKLNS